MPSTGANKRVTISSATDLVIPMASTGECDTVEKPPISPPHGSFFQQLTSSSSSSCSQSNNYNDDYIIRKRELLRLESLVRCQVQSQWQLSIENYSKLRKRQSSQLSSSLDIEMADCSVSSASGQTADPASPSSLSAKEQVSEDEYHESDFGHKPSLWRKTIRSVILRLRGEQQHKDVYVMPQHLRAQLKQMYVY